MRNGRGRGMGGFTYAMKQVFRALGLMAFIAVITSSAQVHAQCSVTTFAVNNGAASTSSLTVTLNNTCTNSPTQYMASESSSFTGATWKTYSTAPSFVLSAGAGTKTVYFKVKNGGGESAVVSDTIDVVGPTVTTFAINGGTASTGSLAVILNNTCTNSPTQYIASESASFSGATWKSYAAAPSLTLSSGVGTKTVYFKAKNASGLESPVVSDTIDYAVLPPAVTSFTINNGTSTTVIPAVSLNNSCMNVPAEYMASESADFAGAAWQSYSTAPTFTLSSYSGIKTVYFKVRNSAGESSPVSSSIERVGSCIYATGYNDAKQLGLGSYNAPSRSLISNSAPITSLSGGNSHSLALKSDGTVWAWGNNSTGQLGDGTITNRTNPVQISGLSCVTAVAAHYDYCLALKSDGTVQAWGANGSGQLGDGTTNSRRTPMPVSGLTNVIAVASGNASSHSLALKFDGTVWAWGQNTYGQLGDGTTTNRTPPVQIPSLTNITAIASGYWHSIALKNDGTVWAWGYNGNGQLGDGTTTNQTTPVQISSLTDITAIAAGAWFSLALKSDGSVWTWGANDYGQLGDGTTTRRLTPVQVSGLTNATGIAAGYAYSLATQNDGTIWTWGNNESGQLGDRTTTNRTTPVQVSGQTIATLASTGGSHTLAMTPDGTILAWGYNYYGQLGNGTTTRQVTVAVPIPAPTNATTIASGMSNYSYALTTDGTVWQWGFYQGLSQVSGLTAVTAVIGGAGHSYALKPNGTVWAWGSNYACQLGDGTQTDRQTPVQVLNLTDITAVASGDIHGLALKTDGTVWSWGCNDYGQLGYSSPYYGWSPAKITGLTGVQAIAAGRRHSLALKTDGTVWAWGWNAYNQLGDGTTTNRATPMQIAGLSNVTAIVAGGHHNFAIQSDGTVWAWGDNYFGQLGDGTTSNRTIPGQISNLYGMTTIAAGYYHNLTLKSDGTVWAWGYNSDGRLGDGTTTDRTTPVQVSGLTGISGIAAGISHSLFLAIKAPVMNAFRVNDGDPSTRERMVTLNSTCTNSPTQYMASESPDFAGADWQSYSASPPFELSAGQGVKTVYFKVRNESGDSVTVSDTIVLASCNTPRMDTNGDLHVDATDFDAFSACYNGPTNKVSGDCLCVDANGDQYVDAIDFDAFSGCYNGPTNPPRCASE